MKPGIPDASRKIMFRKTARRLSALLALVLVFTTAVPVLADSPVNPAATFTVESDSWENWPAAPEIGGQAGCVMDMETGEVLYAKGMNEPRFPASITKIMTALIILENCDLNATVTMTEEGIADAYDGSSNIAPTVGETFTVDQMLQMMLVKSANDVATQLALYEAGSVAAFAEQMTKRAEELGCKTTTFQNANGLEDDWHFTSAYDMALITRAAMAYPRFQEIISQTSITIPATQYSAERVYETHCKMKLQDSGFYYEGGIGGKTGYTDISQNTLVFTANRNGRTMIGVILTAVDGNLINQDMGNLLDYGFNNFSDIDMSYGLEMVEGGTAYVPNGTEPVDVTVEAIPAEENVLVNFRFDDQWVGSATMSQETYHEYATARETENPALVPTEEPAQETEAAVLSAEATSDESAQKSKTTPAQTAWIMRIIMIALAVLIVFCIVMLIVGVRKQKKRNRKRRR